MNKPESTTQPRKTLSLFALTGLLMVSLAFVGANFYLLARTSQHEQGWLRLANEVQVSSQQLSKSAGEAAVGNMLAFTELKESHERITRSMQTLGNGSPSSGLPPIGGPMREYYDQLNMTWRRLDQNTQRIVEREPLVAALTEAASAFSQSIPAFAREAETAVEALISSGAPARQVAAASEQPTHAERMLRQVADIRRGGAGAIEAAKMLEGEMQALNESLRALLRGNSSMGIQRVTDSRAQRALNRMSTSYEQSGEQLQTILDSSTALFEVRGAADAIFLESGIVYRKSEDLASSITQWPEARPWPSLRNGLIGMAFLFIVVALLVRSAIFSERHRAAQATQRDRQNRGAIDQLLTELGSLAEGDLTVEATVNHKVTSDIAESVNYAVHRLREIVTGINQTAHAVSSNAESTRAAAAELAEAAAQQAAQVDEATDDVNNMAEAFDSMATRSSDSSEVAKQSVDIAHSGAEKVRETIAGMDLIRNQIQETSKRIKRLGESSQEIGTIVGLINGIAEQTNVLALNAAIQAASAGGAGKGFAMVADEVQELAESATQATRRIESLVQTIQADTAEAVHSMEDTTSEVVRGANLAEDAGQALQKIEASSNDLSKLIQDIASEAKSQTESTTRLAELMQAVREVSVHNSSTSKDTAQTLEELAELVSQLGESVSDFKLPNTKRRKTDTD
ncbi:MAG: methyl-accepting chemotaxis protein [Lysobacterales bacterium]